MEQLRYNVEEINMPDKDGRRISGWQVWDDRDGHKEVGTYPTKELAEHQCRILNRAVSEE